MLTPSPIRAVLIFLETRMAALAPTPAAVFLTGSTQAMAREEILLWSFERTFKAATSPMMAPSTISARVLLSVTTVATAPATATLSALAPAMASEVSSRMKSAFIFCVELAAMLTSVAPSMEDTSATVSLLVTVTATPTPIPMPLPGFLLEPPLTATASPEPRVI